MSDIDDNINITSKITKQQQTPSIITKKMANLSIIIGVVLFFILLAIVYKIYGVFGLCNGLFLLSFYVLMLSFIFFTIGIQVENKVIKKNIDFIIERFKKEAPNMKLKKLKLTKDQQKQLKKDDEKTDRQNNKIIYKTLAYFGSFVILLLIASLTIWKKFNNDFKIFKNFIVIKNLIVLVVVMIVQIIFYKLVIQNNRPIGIYDLIENLIHKLKNKN